MEMCRLCIENRLYKATHTQFIFGITAVSKAKAIKPCLVFQIPIKTFHFVSKKS